MLDSYGRLSRVPETGELEKVETQLADNRKVIERTGSVLGEELSDGLSAWNRRVRRPGWERLLERVESGESDGIVVWHTDRLFRQPRDLERLIELGDKGFRVYSAHGERDLSDPDDRFILRIEVAQAAKSSDDTSRRIKRRFATKRAQGVAHLGGPRRFGWPGKDRNWKPGPGEDKDDRPDVPQEQVEAERAALRDGTDAMLSGVSSEALARKWNAQGLLSPEGKAWNSNSVRAVLIRPTNAGLIEYEGKLVGKTEGDPIVDPDQFARLRALYASRRRGRRWGEVGTRYVGSGIIRCGKCDRPLYGKRSKDEYPDGERRMQYFCSKQRRGCGEVFADCRSVDKELRALTIVRLSDSRHAAAIEAARAKVVDRLSEVRKQIAVCEEIQAGLTERLGRRELTLEAFDRANEHLAADLARLRAEREQLDGGAPEGPVKTQSREVIAAQWDDAKVPERRALLTSALGRSVVKVLPAPRPGAKFDAEKRLVLVSPESGDRAV